MEKLYFWNIVYFTFCYKSDQSDPYKFCFYCSETHVTSQVLQPKSVNKWYRGRHTVISVHGPQAALL